MRQDRVHNSLLAQVPNLYRVVVAASGHLVSVGQKVDRDYLLDVCWELKDVLAATQIPHKADSVQVTRAEQTTVSVERHRKN